MRTLKHSMTPLAAVVAGSLAGAVGTICLDAVQYLKYRRTGGTETPLKWEFAPVDTWEKAPDPGQVGKRLIEGFTQRELPDRWAWPVSTVMHWSYGSAWGAFYGVLAGSLRRPDALYGLPFGAAVWVSGYLILPAGRALQADLGVSRENPGHGPERPSCPRGRDRSSLLAALQDPVASQEPLVCEGAPMPVSRLRHIPGIGVDKVGDAADAAR